MSRLHKLLRSSMDTFSRSLRPNPEAQHDRKIKLPSATPEVRQHPLVQQAYEQMALGRREIETRVSDEALARRLLDHVIAQWEALGAAEPYFCNDNAESYKIGKISKTKVDEFYRQGDAWMKTLSAFEDRSGVKIEDGVCVELGAGAGKYTHALSRRFAHVIAVDVSGPLLEINQSRLKELGRSNVTTAVLRSPSDLASYGSVDFFLAQNVFLVNPPPIQRLMLETALESLTANGFTWFQTPDWIRDYSFSSKRFLEEAPDADCECHCLPKTDVLEILRDHGMVLLDFNSDFLTECSGSWVYFAQKRGA